MSNCTLIAANPDVSGIGIRVNLYTTMLVMALVPNIPGVTSPLLNVVAGNAGISGVALLITAIVETAQQQLSLYHAIFILHILYFTGVMVAPGGNYNSSISTHSKRIIITLLTYGALLLFTGYAFYVWAKAPSFGSSPECNNEIKYVFFFHSVRATAGWLRKLWMAMLGITLGVFIIVPLIGYACCTAFGGATTVASHERHSRVPTTSVVVYAMITNLEKILGTVYAISMLELYERRNSHLIKAGEQAWTFGQILAIVQIFRILIEVIHCIMSWFPRDESGDGDGDGEDTTSVRTSVGRRPIRLIPWKRQERHERTDSSDHKEPFA